LGAHNQACSHGRKRIKLVAVSGASNVLGVYNPLAEIGQIVHRHGARLLVDAAQWVAHRKVETIKRLLGVPPWVEQIQRLMLSLLPGFNLPGLVRVSFGIQNSEAEVDHLIEVLGVISQKPRAKRLGRNMDNFVAAAVQQVYAPLGRTVSGAFTSPRESPALRQTDR
jgi:cysteine sulfinate desulfinase/cysteine desulfurase-like protein